MESVTEEAMPAMRKTSKLIIRKPDVDKLKALGDVLPDESMSKFKSRYGKITNLLAPTLEEFTHIIEQHLGEGKPYHFHGNFPRVETVASVFGVDPGWLNNKSEGEKTPKGIPRVRLEELMNSLVERKG